MTGLDASTTWGIFAWLVGITAGGGFFMGALFTVVGQHGKRLDKGDEAFKEIREEQAQVAKALVRFEAMQQSLLRIEAQNQKIWAHIGGQQSERTRRA